MEMRFLRPALIALAVLLAAPAFAQDTTARDMDSLRQRLKADKKAVVEENMELTDAEAKVFWPLYEAYQSDLGPINERVSRLIGRYADLYLAKKLTDQAAKELLDEVVAVEQAEVSLKQAYVRKLTAVLPAVRVARYMQIESKIRAVVKYVLADGIPLAR
jgi:hypothetical protein